MQSNTINKLAESLAKVQAELTPVPRNAENPFYKSSYADLSACIRHAAPLLSKHGLAVVQAGAESKDGEIAIRTTLVHSSGEWIDGVMAAKPSKYDPQGSGSAVTYLRRYGYNAIIGLAQEGEDDDGNAATHTPKQAAKPATFDVKPKAEPPGRFEQIVDGATCGDFLLEDYKAISSKPGAAKPWSGNEVTLVTDSDSKVVAATIDPKLGDKLATLKGAIVTATYQPGSKAGTFKLISIDLADSQLPPTP